MSTAARESAPEPFIVAAVVDVAICIAVTVIISLFTITHKTAAIQFSGVFVFKFLDMAVVIDPVISCHLCELLIHFCVKFSSTRDEQERASSNPEDAGDEDSKDAGVLDLDFRLKKRFTSEVCKDNMASVSAVVLAYHYSWGAFEMLLSE
ncbi:hypothetical protein PInf_003562 [Phytophthora infestans]|nr:hypothetical protein PInf_003562 [Phytophthora infestans]